MECTYWRTTQNCRSRGRADEDESLQSSVKAFLIVKGFQNPAFIRVSCQVSRILGSRQPIGRQNQGSGRKRLSRKTRDRCMMGNSRMDCRTAPMAAELSPVSAMASGSVFRISSARHSVLTGRSPGIGSR